MKNLTKLMNCFNIRQNSPKTNVVLRTNIKPKDLQEYQFQWLILEEEGASEMFQELKEIIVHSLKDRLIRTSISLHNIGIRNISKQIQALHLVIKEKLCSEVLDNITTEQIVEYLKNNNYHQNLEIHIQKLFRDLSNYYTGMVLFLKLYYKESKRVNYDSYAFINGFCEKIINICVGVTYFDKGFCCDEMKRYNSLIYVKSKFAKIGLKESSDLLTVKRRNIELRLENLNKYEQGVSQVDYLDNSAIRLSLIDSLEEIEEEIGYLGRFDFDYVKFPTVFENIYSYLFENSYILSSYEIFMSVLFHQRGTIMWNKEQYTIVQFIGFLHVHTSIVEDIKMEFIPEFFSYPKTDDSLDSAYKKRIELGTGKRKRDDYLMLKPILNYIPDKWIRPKKL